MTRSAKPLFQAIKAKHKDTGPELIADMPEQRAPQDGRDPLDYDPTPPEPTLAFLAREGARIRELTDVIWEPAVGGGHMAQAMCRAGFRVYGSDIVDRGYPGTVIRDFRSFDRLQAPAIITNPPYNLISARDGNGQWLRHALDLGAPYVAFLLNWDWPAAKGLGALLAQHPISRAYLCRWKIDFRGGGSPPQRNGWFVWDAGWPHETAFRFLDRDEWDDTQQGSLL